MADKNTNRQTLSAGVDQMASVKVIDIEVIGASVRQTFAIKAD